MGFVRRKSVAAADTDDARSRNRLSKPKPMSSSRTTLNERWTDAESQGLSASQLSLETHTKPLSRQQSRVHVKSHLFDTTGSVEPQPEAAHRSKRGGVASLVKQFESTASTSQLSLTTPAVLPRSAQEIYTLTQSTDTQRHLRVSATSSRDQLSERLQSTSTIVSPSASSDHLVDPFAIPRRRESKYRPGEATRKPLPRHQEQRSPGQQGGQKEKSYYMQATADETMLSHQVEVGEWNFSSPTGRTDTPTSIDVKSIGALRLGSLHVVNGHSSPARSELSRQVISHQLRDVSSEYADSEHEKESVSDTWEDAELIDEIESNGPPTPTRSAFDIADTCEPSTPDRGAGAPRPGTSSRLQTPTKSPDKTSMMAQAYMSELQGSPFSYDGSSPASTGSVIHREQIEQHGDSSLPRRDSDCATAKRDFSFESKQESIDSGVSSVPTARARDDIFASALEYQAPHFEPPASPERGISPEYQRPESVSKISDKADSGYYSGTSMLSLNAADLPQLPVGSGSQLGQPEISANVDIQKDVTPKKTASPKKLGGFLPLRPAFRRAPTTEPVMPTILNVQTESPVAKSYAATPAKMEPSPKQAKKEREREEKREKERERDEKREREREEKKAKAQKKLQKSRPLSKARQSQEIVVQRLPSGESAGDFPPVPDTAAANLKRRSLLVPELERTFRSQNDIKIESSTSNLALPMSDIRFPSPMPVEDRDESRSRSAKKTRDRSRSRPRSKSRRRSFLDYFRSDKESNGDTGVSEEQTRLSIADFGDVVSSLGTNPYDIAHSRAHSPEPKPRNIAVPRTNPHNITVNRHRPRASMNDEEASEFARSRSHSLNERKEESPHKSSFSDREGLPGRNLRTSIILDDAPPMPPLPTREELRRISMRQSLPPSQPNTPSKAEVVPHDETYGGPFQNREYDLESSPAPLPPAHSPRPAFVDQQYDHEYEIEDELELAPPPPSHSPAPMDIPALPLPSHSPRPRDVPSNRGAETEWESQARAWKERRQSAGEALRHHRRSWNERDAQHDEYYEQAVEDEFDPEYPAIPPRHPGRNEWSHDPRQSWENGINQYNSPQTHSQFHRAQTWNEGSYNQDQDYDRQHFDDSQMYDHSSARRYHTWDESQDFYSANGSALFYQQRGNGSRQSGHMSRGSNDSRQSFYNHQNVPIDRPFDPPAQLSQDFDDEDYGYSNEYYTPRTSPVRRQGPDRFNHDYNRRYEHDRQHPYAFQSQQLNQRFHSHENGYSAHSSPAKPRSNRDSHSHQRQSRSPQPSPLRSHHNSLAPPSPSPSRPRSQQSRHSLVSLRSNGSAVSLADELHPEIEERPSVAPDFGRYSGGLGYGYEGRDRGFGGSAGTRTVSGKADGGWKGTQLRGSFGVDLGDVPVIGLVKKMKA